DHVLVTGEVHELVVVGQHARRSGLQDGDLGTLHGDFLTTWRDAPLDSAPSNGVLHEISSKAVPYDLRRGAPSVWPISRTRHDARAPCLERNDRFGSRGPKPGVRLTDVRFLASFRLSSAAHALPDALWCSPEPKPEVRGRASARNWASPWPCFTRGPHGARSSGPDLHDARIRASVPPRRRAPGPRCAPRAL